MTSDVDNPEISQNWWADFFESDLWGRFHLIAKSPEQTLQEIEFILKVAPKSASLDILDMPCGIGRHAIELARRGHTVHGIDKSKNLLRIAIEKAKVLDRPPVFQNADMRNFKKTQSFEVALTLWGSLGYFSDLETQQMFSNIRASLKPGGVFIFDLPVLDTFLKGGYSPNHWIEKDGLYVLEKAKWDSETGRNHSEWVFIQNDQKISHHSSVRIYTYHELHTMLKTAGFSKITAYGSLDMKPFNMGDRLYGVAHV